MIFEHSSIYSITVEHVGRVRRGGVFTPLLNIEINAAVAMAASFKMLICCYHDEARSLATTPGGAMVAIVGRPRSAE